MLDSFDLLLQDNEMRGLFGEFIKDKAKLPVSNEQGNPSTQTVVPSRARKSSNASRRRRSSSSEQTRSRSSSRKRMPKYLNIKDMPNSLLISLRVSYFYLFF